MVFELTDAEIQSMNYTAGKHKEHTQKIVKKVEEAKQQAKCTCPIKIETKSFQKYKKQLKQNNSGLLYKRRHTNGYDLTRPLCPVHDVVQVGQMK